MKAVSETATSALLKGLNPQQRDAVTHGDGPLLIIAGAGTGKTSVVTRRIAWLIEQGRAEPDEILALTFTDKAAVEMQERLLGLLSRVPDHIQTFHAFGDSILREYSYELGLPSDFAVLGEAEQVIFLDEHLFDELPLTRLKPYGRPAKFLQSLAKVFSRAKNENKSPADYEAWVAKETARVATLKDPKQKADAAHELEIQREIAAAFVVYERLKDEKHRLDYADQVYKVVRLLTEQPVIRQRLADRFKFVLVDEFQDTNVVQNELLNLLVPPGEGNLNVVGDDDQSIFSFQGSAISNILEFEETHGDAKRVVLTTNYRSTQQILDASHDLIAENPDRLEAKDQIDKRLKATGPDGPKVVFEPNLTVDDEADRVAAHIAERHPRTPYYEMAILVRVKSLIEPFAQALRARGIPYRAEGTGRLFDQPEIKLCVSFLRVVSDPGDSAALKYLAQSPVYDFPQADLLALARRVRQTHRSLWQLLDELDETYSTDARRVAERLRADVTKFAKLAPDLTVAQLLFSWLEQSGYTKFLREHAPEQEAAAANLARLFDRLRQFVAVAENRTAEAWIKHLDDIIAIEDESVSAETDAHFDAVPIVTVHAAKGLEFEVVFVVGCVQGKFPTYMRGGESVHCNQLLANPPDKERHREEERRLFYVAMTRAKRELILTAATDYRSKKPWRLSEFVSDVVGPEAVSLLPKVTADPLAKIAQSRPLPPLAVGYEPPELIPLSFTSLKSYQTCPLKYYWEHVIGLRSEPTFTLQYGTLIHQVIQQINLAKLHGQAPSEAQVTEWFDGAWKGEYFLSATHEKEARERGKRTMLRFLKEEADREPPTAVEEQFAFPLAGCVVKGKYDRIDRHKGKVTIVDYKTGQVDAQEVADDRARKDPQLTLYALAHFEQTGALPDQVVFNYVDSGLAGVSTRTEAQIEKMRAEIEEQAEKIRHDDFQHPNRSPHECSPFADCPGHRVPHRTEMGMV